MTGGRQEFRMGARSTRAPFHAQIFLCAGEISRNRPLGRGTICKSPMPQWDLDPASMADKPPLSPETPLRRRGRPSRKEELQRALAELGVDPALVDPLRVLASIAGDAEAAPTARVAAAKTLLAARDPAGKPGKGKGRSSKKALAQRRAARAGGRGTPWGDDLEPNGRRAQ